MKAVIMAGGEGSRLRPLTIARPKPMVPVVDRPAIVHIIELLKKHGITEVVITLQYLAAVIQEYLGDGTNYGMKITLYGGGVAAGHCGVSAAGYRVARRHLYSDLRRCAH